MAFRSVRAGRTLPMALYQKGQGSVTLHAAEW